MISVLRGCYMLYCQYCNKECKNTNSLKNHERVCKHNPNRELTSFEKGVNPHKYADTTVRRGIEYESPEFSRCCPHCSRWFKPSQIGGHVVRCSKLHNEDRHVIVEGTALDITVPQLLDYMKDHPRCEICGKSVEESVKYTGKEAAKRLCIDHDHSTNKFRGMLCQVCNRQLGWFEKYQAEIYSYIKKTE